MSIARGRAFQDLGQNIFAIGQIAAAASRQRAADEQQAAEDKRRRDREDEAQRMARLEIDTQLVERGGGRGAPPTVSREIPGTAPMPTFEPPSLFGDRSGGVGVRAPDSFLAKPPMPEAGPVSVQEPDPRFAPVGEPGFGYVMTPGALQEEQNARELSLETGKQTARLGAIGRAYRTLNPDMSEPEAGAMAVLADENVPASMVPGAGRDGAPDRERLPTFSQAMDFVREKYADMSQPEGTYTVSFDQMRDEALALSRGEEYTPPESTGPSPDQIRGAMQGYPQPRVDAVVRRAMGGGAPPEPEPEVEAVPEAPAMMNREPLARAKEPQTEAPPAATAPLSDVEVEEIRGMLRGLTRSQQMRALQEEGASPEEIRQILGG